MDLVGMDFEPMNWPNVSEFRFCHVGVGIMQEKNSIVNHTQINRSQLKNKERFEDVRE